VNKNRLNYDVLDDALYLITKSNVIAAQQTKNVTTNAPVKPKPNAVKGPAE